jgi:hypothetical protein
MRREPCGDTKTVETPSAIAPSGWETQLVKGPSQPEDLAPLPGTDYLVVSGLSAHLAKGSGSGHLYLKSVTTDELTEIWPKQEHALSWDQNL